MSDTADTPRQIKSQLTADDIDAAEARARDLAAQAAALRRAATKAKLHARQLESERAAGAIKALRQPRTPGRPRSVRKSLLITPELVVRCADYCRAHSLSFNAMVETALLALINADNS